MTGLIQGAPRGYPGVAQHPKSSTICSVEKKTRRWWESARVEKKISLIDLKTCSWSLLARNRLTGHHFSGYSSGRTQFSFDKRTRRAL